MNVQTIDSIPAPLPVATAAPRSARRSQDMTVTDGVHRDARFDNSTFVASGAVSPGDAPRNVRRLYGRAAVAAAIENGLMPDELGEVLGGRRVVEAFPVDGGESVAAYAHRAVAEMMVAYLRHDVA